MSTTMVDTVPHGHCDGLGAKCMNPYIECWGKPTIVKG